VVEVTLFDPDAKYGAAHACGCWLSGVLRTITRQRRAGGRRFIHKLSTDAAGFRRPGVLELKESNLAESLGFGGGLQGAQASLFSRAVPRFQNTIEMPQSS
jgi:hypothetical protein